MGRINEVQGRWFACVHDAGNRDIEGKGWHQKEENREPSTR